MRPSGKMGGEEREEKGGKERKKEYKIMLTKTGENGKRRKEERELEEEKESRHLHSGVQGSKGKNVRE